MLPTYPATLRDGKLDWGENGPPALPPSEVVPVHVTLLSRRPDPVSGSAMAAALSAIAAAGGPDAITDPADWQREMHVDRLLPGRAS